MPPKCHATDASVSTSSTRRCTLQSSTPLPNVLTPTNALAVIPLTIWSGNVHFPRQIRWRRLHRRTNRADMAGTSPVTSPSVTSPLHGNTLNATPLWTKSDATCPGERLATKEPIANGHTFVKSAGGEGGAIPRPIPIDVWRDALRNHPESALVTDLLHDIEYGVRIGFHNERIPLISSNHFSALSNPEPVANELEQELLLNRKAEPFLVPPSSHFVESPMGSLAKKHSQPVKWRIINRSFVAG